MTMSYEILASVCLSLPRLSECMYVRMYVCMYDVRHDMQIPCTRYLAINSLYLYIYFHVKNLMLPSP